jgi:hypothetical protein
MKTMKATMIVTIEVDDDNDIQSYSIELPYSSVKDLTKNDEEVIERIRDQYFWLGGFKYDGRLSFKPGKDQTQKLMFKRDL